jgi:hypothetical protein
VGRPVGDMVGRPVGDLVVLARVGLGVGLWLGILMARDSRAGALSHCLDGSEGSRRSDRSKMGMK